MTAETILGCLRTSRNIVIVEYNLEKIIQHRQYTNNTTLRRVRVTILTVEKQ
jgi:hypothetical protein